MDECEPLPPIWPQMMPFELYSLPTLDVAARVEIESKFCKRFIVF